MDRLKNCGNKYNKYDNYISNISNIFDIRYIRYDYIINKNDAFKCYHIIKISEISEISKLRVCCANYCVLLFTNYRKLKRSMLTADNSKLEKNFGNSGIHCRIRFCHTKCTS